MRALRCIPFLILLTACLSAPVDTLNKRFAVFESGYAAVLQEIEKLEQADSFKPETALRLALALEEVNRYRKAANLARTSGDLLKSNDALDLAQAALTRLQQSIPQGTKL